MNQLLRSIPAIHEMQNNERFNSIVEKNKLDFSTITQALKEILDEIRQQILSAKWEGPNPGTNPFLEYIFNLLEEKIQIKSTYNLKTIINATGTILHTNLGRARLSENALKHVIETAHNYSNLEYILEEGKRGSRHSHIESLLSEITGAEAAMVVNNNAAAVFLVLKALAEKKEVIVSRGELIEIGGSFRISSIMEESGAKLVEVGTTNKTHLYDYEKGISSETAMVMKVHTSNFKTIGFTKAVETKEISSFIKKYEQIIFYEDLGSGALFDFRKHGIGEEPVVKEVINMGTDIVSFSGDKLLGGPQAGIIAGKKELIDRLKKHQLARVVRVDKMTLAALEGTLVDYLKGETGLRKIPTVRDLLVSVEDIKKKTEGFLNKLSSLTGNFQTRMIKGNSQVGGGTMPEVELPTFVAVLKHDTLTAEQIARKLRNENTPAIVGRIQKEEFVLDLRTVTPEEEAQLLEALLAI